MTDLERATLVKYLTSFESKVTGADAFDYIWGAIGSWDKEGDDIAFYAESPKYDSATLGQICEEATTFYKNEAVSIRVYHRRGGYITFYYANEDKFYNAYNRNAR